MLAGGFGGGGAAGESAATNAGVEAGTEAAIEGLADDALGSAVTKAAGSMWDKMGFTNPLFSGSNPALGFILGNPQSGFGMMADNYRKYGRR